MSLWRSLKRSGNKMYNTNTKYTSDLSRQRANYICYICVHVDPDL